MSVSPTAESSILERLRARRILVTCGLGGVGKTTLSAALAVRAALDGKRAVVITIDPAKRLATSLGLRELGDQPTDLTEPLRRALAKARPGIELRGTLSAIVPDTRRTFESFVADLAPNPAIAERVMRNPIFQIFAREFSGTNEYMALERLHGLARHRDFDTIILDTPPSRDTLAFLDAPQLLAKFFEERLIHWLVMPANRLLSAGMKTALGILEKLTGSGFMKELFDFAASLFEVRISFLANLRSITELLKSPQVGFLLVAQPHPESAEDLAHFAASVRDHQFGFDGLILNRTLGYLPREAGEGHHPAPAAMQILEALQAREAQAVERIARALEAADTAGAARLHAQLPELARDVHSLEDLLYVALALG